MQVSFLFLVLFIFIFLYRFVVYLLYTAPWVGSWVPLNYFFSPVLFGQESQPSPLALLAATCSRIESPNENSNNSQGPSQSGGTGELDLTATQLSQGANGWQIISSSSGATPTSKEQSGRIPGVSDKGC